MCFGKHATAHENSIFRGENMAEKHGIPAQKIHIGTCKEAQNIPSVSALFRTFYNGKFVTHELMNEGKFGKFVQTLK